MSASFQRYIRPYKTARPWHKCECCEKSAFFYFILKTQTELIAPVIALVKSFFWVFTAVVHRC